MSFSKPSLIYSTFKRAYMMYSVILIFSVLVIIIPFSTSLLKNKENALDQTELLMTFMIHRHGDRTPVELNLKYVTDREKVNDALKAYGYGQLNNAGILRSYKLGGFIRHRYNDFLSRQYKASEIYIRASGSARAKMTVLAAMAAVYPLQNSWCEGVRECLNVNWTPVPYDSEDPIYDFNLAVANCPKFIRGFFGAFVKPAPQMAKYSEILDKWSKIIGVDITRTPGLSYLIYDVYNSQMSLGIPLTPEVEELLPEIREVALASYAVVCGNASYVSLNGGVLLKKFFEVANNIISGEEVPRVHVYSVHDVNVYSMLVVSKVEPRLPEYGALFALELRRDLVTGQHVVVPVYLKTPDKYEVTYLQVEGCGELCELSKFHEIVSEHIMDVKEWRKRCEWSEDYDFDLAIIA